MKNRKTALSLVAAWALIVSASASEAPAGKVGHRAPIQTLQSTESGWYLAPQLRHTWLYEADTLMPGARAAWVLDRSWSLGGELSIAANSLLYTGSNRRSNYRLTYGGAYIEHPIRPERPFHGAASVLIGGGSTQREDFLSLEPRLDALINLSKTVRAGWGVSFRLTRSLQRNEFSTERVGGLATQIFLQLGEL